MPERVILKLAYDLEHLPWPLYANEVRFYNDIRPQLDIEMPQVLGAAYDHDSHRFLLLLEDLTLRGAVFPNVLRDNSVEEVKSVLDVVATLHAYFWQSPRFTSDLSNFETHVDGTLNDFMIGDVIHHINHEIATNPFKQNIMAMLDMSSEQMLGNMIAMQRHQASLPQTVLHGDTHIGNTYLLPDGKAGLLDLQLSVRGYCMHDVSYLISTALPVDQRRTHEQPLIRYYLERLASYGVDKPPTFAEVWPEYQRAIVWGVYIGWMTCSEANYGWQIQANNLLRLSAAYADHDATHRIAEIR